VLDVAVHPVAWKYKDVLSWTINTACSLTHSHSHVVAAFNTSTGMPYGTVNLVSGIPSGETTVTCTAGVGTFVVEFGSLTQLTGDPVFMNVAVRALEALWQARSPISLVRTGT